MWRSISNKFGNFEKKRSTTASDNLDYVQSSDDEICSNASGEEGLECPICWESFNIVENVPYVLWCGHTLCKHCVLGLKWASLNFSCQQVRIPFFVSCPWCSMLTLRLIYKGNLKFPRKNFFLLWMVESRNGDRMKIPSSIPGESQVSRCISIIGSPGCAIIRRRAHEYPYYSNNEDESTRNTNRRERTQLSLQKSLDFFICLSAKIPLVLVFLLIVTFVLPSCATILVLYLVITILFVFPAFLVLYFAYPVLGWLAREITT